MPPEANANPAIGNDQQTPVRRAARTSQFDQPRQRAGPLDDREGPADQEDVEDDRARVRPFPSECATSVSKGPTGVAANRV